MAGSGEPADDTARDGRVAATLERLIFGNRLVIIMLFALAMQRWLVRGLTMGAVKE